jgi:hypothetical protein
MAGVMLLGNALVLAVAYRGTAWREAAEKREHPRDSREGAAESDQREDSRGEACKPHTTNVNQDSS